MEKLLIDTLKNNASSRGRPGYSYYRLFATILYGFSFDRYTLRELEDACKYDLRYIYLMEQETPRHTKFCDFINKVIVHNEEEIFSLINLEIQKVTNIEFEDAFIDGTKYEANANKYKFVWKPIKHHKNLSIKIGSIIKERGLVVSFDDETIVIKYENEERTYCPDIAFKNKFLSFLDNSLNLSFYEDLSIKEELKLQHEKEAEANRKIVINRSKKIKEL